MSRSHFIIHLLGSGVSKKSLVVSSSGDKMTSSPTEMRTTAVTKPAVKTSCHGCSCREDALVNSRQHSRKPRQTTTPTLSRYLRSHPSPNSGYAQESYNLRPRQTTTPTLSGYLRSHQQVPTAATPKRATISDQDYVHGWTTPRQSGYLHAIASAQGSASQPTKLSKRTHLRFRKLQTILHTSAHGQCRR